jgi:Flp pilus assembly pilin Flp
MPISPRRPSVEYGLIAALIAVAAIAALQAVGTNVTAVFTTVGNNL